MHEQRPPQAGEEALKGGDEGEDGPDAKKEAHAQDLAAEGNVKGGDAGRHGGNCGWVLW